AKAALDQVEDELFANRRQHLAGESLRRFGAFHEAYQRLVPEKGGLPVAYPFQVTRRGDDLVATLAGDDLPLKTLRAPALESLAERGQRRRETTLGKIIALEGGLFILRNSWGNAGREGVRGYYHMTYAYFLAHTDE